MNVTSISKIQIQEKQRALLGTSFIEELNAAKVGMTATQYLIPTDKFILLKNKYQLKEEDQQAPLTPTNKIMTKQTISVESQKKKKGCSSCNRRK